jgi:SNF2 family DNA or RNA helicase
MMILHGAIEKGELHVWAETSFESLPKIRKSRLKDSPPKPHPFSADPEQICNALSFLEIESTQFQKSRVWTPSLGELPLPSTPILGSLPESKNSLGLSSTVVWSCSLDTLQTLEFLRRVENKETFPHGTFFGKEFPFLNQLKHFIFSLVLRQRFLPSMKRTTEGFVPHWTPTLLGQDKTRLHQLETAMPSALSAFTTSLKKLEPLQHRPKALIHSFIEESLDALVKYSDYSAKSSGENAHDQWLEGLTSPRVFQESPQTVQLAQSIKEWQQPVQNLATSPFKLCFRIEEPKETKSINKELVAAESPWNVSYFLQAHDDASLLVTTEDVWNPKGAKRKALARHHFQPRQFVLTSLGMSTGLCPYIEPSLHEPIPTGFALNSAEAFAFFMNYAAKLEEAGFGVICPNWWKRNKMQLSAKAIVESSFQAKRRTSIWDQLKTDWQIHLGDLGLSKEELFELSLLKEPIVKMRGEWVLLKKEDIQNALAFLEKKKYQPKNAIDFLQVAAGIPKEVHGIAIEGVEASGEIAKLFDSLKSNSPLEVLETPKGFLGQLRPYQLRGYSWISFLQQWQLGACLADDMGLGKTPQTLAVILRRWEELETKKPTLLVCPTSLTGNWSRESAKFVPELPIYVHHGTDRKKGKSFSKLVNKQGLVITSYALLHRDEALFEEVEWDGIILDEAQNIKNAETKQSKAAFRLKGDYRLALTGTPVENNVGDLWSIMHFLNPGYLGSQDKFRSQFFNPIQLDKNPAATHTLQQLTKPLILRRLKTDRSIITDLPEKLEMKVYCSLTQEQITLYETVVNGAEGLLKNSEGIERKGLILATLSKLKQICNHPVHFLKDRSNLEERSGKLVRLQEMLEEIDSIGEKSLIFTQFSEMGELLKKHLEAMIGKEILFLHGATSKKNRDLMVERFQNEEKDPPIFILSLKAGGVGLNLTRANHVFHFDRWWNPAIENQATDRAFRIGQKKNVQVHKFICNGTIEERIDEMLESKKEVAENVIGTGEGWITELSTDQLRDLWSLQKTKI